MALEQRLLGPAHTPPASALLSVPSPGFSGYGDPLASYWGLLFNPCWAFTHFVIWFKLHMKGISWAGLSVSHCYATIVVMSGIEWHRVAGCSWQIDFPTWPSGSLPQGESKW